MCSGSLASKNLYLNTNLNIPILVCTAETAGDDVQKFILDNSRDNKYSCVQIFNNELSESVYNMGFGEYGNFFIFIMRANPGSMVLLVINHWTAKSWIISVSENGYIWKWKTVTLT